MWVKGCASNVGSSCSTKKNQHFHELGVQFSNLKLAPILHLKKGKYTTMSLYKDACKEDQKCYFRDGKKWNSSTVFDVASSFLVFQSGEKMHSML